MPGVRWVALLLLAVTSTAVAGGIDTGAACRDWRQVPVPAAHAGAAPEACSAQALYYGADGTRGDPVAARHCAYRERGLGTETVSWDALFGGSGVLMMVYANGEGVPRDLALARRFACEYGGAPAELHGRLAHLQAIADAGTGRLDICDHITSGMMAGVCARRDAGFARVVRDRKWQTLQADWTPAQHVAWRSLRAAADAYFDHAGRDEVDLGGTARGAFAVQAREALESRLIEDVGAFERGGRPTQTAADLAALDRELNAVYRRTRADLQAGAAAHEYSLFGTVDADGVRETQRAWLRYREAWVSFAATRWPDAAADVWRAWLTHARTGALDAITGDP
ncbi:lysozyme inhibitor LprI family protein [Luteimonas sp. WGS1318]|uniref:lysozyme inhibitor LprI family protein n=1 Tax=Luteimonas sp. WGS1318 TaxID=3366815 RepID=UPI00372D8037